MTLPASFVTHLTGLLSGDAVCEFSAWAQARHKYPRTGADFTAWRAAHTALVQKESEALSAEQWHVRLENQNWWRLSGETATLSGKPDIVASKHGVFRVVDVKSGTPEDKHRIQVAIYLIALPLSWQRPLRMHGKLVYPDRVEWIEPEEAEHTRKPLFALMKRIGSSDRPEPRPSWKECRFCPVAKADCSVKVETEPVDVLTSEF